MDDVIRNLPLLSPLEAQVIRLRYGIGVGTDHTAEATGRVVGIDPARVKAIETEALRKLKHPLNIGEL